MLLKTLLIKIMKVNTNITHDILQGGTRVRKHPLPGIAMNTYEPSTLAVGDSTLKVGGKKKFTFKKRRN